MKKRQVIKTIVVSLLVLLLITIIYFFQFISTGYRISVPYRHSFIEIDDNVYMNRDFSGNKDELITLISDAKKRDTDFWRELQSNPVIIFCDNKKLLSRLGGDHDTLTVFFPAKQSYISISHEYCNIDILAHEMTHAELHCRLSAKALDKIPSWFDEGLAVQNDYREQYGLDAWIKQTDNGKNAVTLEDMDEPSEFYAGTADDRRFRYLNAKHEVSEWMEVHKQQGLLELLDKLNDDEDFNTAYGS